MIRCVTFDLDDTLWDCAPVIARAEEKFFAWLVAHYPEVGRYFTSKSLIEHRKKYMARYPDLHHDLTLLRKQWLGEVGLKTGCGGAFVESGFQVFWRARNEVELFHGARDALEALNGRYILGAITNGNADVHTVGIGEYFQFAISAAGAGAAKPSPIIFEAALDEAGVGPEEAVHVGDDPKRDIRGAASAGMRTVWVNVHNQTWPGGARPDATITQLTDLLNVLEQMAA